VCRRQTVCVSRRTAVSRSRCKEADREEFSSPVAQERSWAAVFGATSMGLNRSLLSSTRRPATDVAVIVGENVRALREQRGESQQTFARRACFDRANLNRLEKGMRDPNLTTLVRLAKALDVEPWELLCDRGISAPRSSMEKAAK
jgi:DNA-binding XRE family transcriptional regulator